MATRNESLARVGAAVQMAAMIAQMVDSNSTGVDDRVGKIAQQIGAACVKAAAGDLKNGPAMLREAAHQLEGLADEMEAGG